ncbi:MAG: hypothetical protein WBE32_17385 [Pseudolabrys sp.]
MTKSDHRKPINFVGMYFIDEHGEDYRTGQIIAQISDGYYLAQFDCMHDNAPPPPLEVLSTSTKSATIVVHAIGNSLPTLKLGRDGSLG